MAESLDVLLGDLKRKTRQKSLKHVKREEL
jgi:hypothetical protein